jgi:3',5'-cyclic AMP phosphodiesterase CpdA
MSDDSAVPGTVMARLARPRTERPTRLALIADPHVSTRAAGTSKLFDRTVRHLRAAVEDIATRDADAVLSAGDLTKDGEPWNYEAVDAVLDALEAPFFSVPGNHDVPKADDDHDPLPVADFAERYATGEFPFVERVGGVDLIGLNSAGSADRLADDHGGRIPEAHLDWLAETLASVENPVVLVHHNLPAVADQVREHRDAVAPSMAIPPTLHDTDRLVETLAAGDAPLLLTGHLHMPATGELSGVREVMAPTTCSFPQGYLLLDVDESGTTIRFVPVAGRDGLRDAFHVRTADSVTSAGLTAMAATRLAGFPLVDELASD